jgi:membrane protease YdiL (CAAX protease family)
LNRITRNTKGILNGNLVLNVGQLLVVVGGLMIGLGRLRWRDLGLVRQTILPGILFAVCVWGIANLFSLGVAIIEGDAVAVDRRWIEAPHKSAGLVLAAVATAACEEAVFRGFILIQLALRLTRSSSPRIGIALITAVLASSLVFAAGHIPYLLRVGAPSERHIVHLALWFGYGLLFAAVYLRSRNLLHCIAVHAILLAPDLVGTADGAKSVSLLVVACWLVLSLVRQNLHLAARTGS